MIFPETIAAVPILVASFLGSAHCIGMCGGFVAIYSHNSNRAIFPHVLYSLGRLTTYLILGILASTVGRNVDSISGLGRVSSLFVGSSLIAIGLLELIKGNVGFFGNIHRRVGNLVGAAVAPVFNLKGVLKPFLIGLVSTFLPCGWLYAFVALAFGSADPRAGITIMLFFWLGTLPALWAFGFASRFVTERIGSRMPRLTAILLIMSGLLSLTMHTAHHHEHGGATAIPHTEDHAHDH